MVGIGKLMKQAQQMQKKLAQLQQEAGSLEMEGTSGGGMVKAVVNGKKEVISLTISPEVVDKDDVQMLEDLVLAALRQALEKAEAATQQKMAGLTAGMGLPPGLGI